MTVIDHHIYYFSKQQTIDCECQDYFFPTFCRAQQSSSSSTTNTHFRLTILFTVDSIDKGSESNMHVQNIISTLKKLKFSKGGRLFHKTCMYWTVINHFISINDLTLSKYFYNGMMTRHTQGCEMFYRFVNNQDSEETSFL